MVHKTERGWKENSESFWSPQYLFYDGVVQHENKSLVSSSHIFFIDDKSAWILVWDSGGKRQSSLQQQSISKGWKRVQESFRNKIDLKTEWISSLHLWFWFWLKWKSNRVL